MWLHARPACAAPQNCKWHLQTLRKKELPGQDSEGEGAEATAAERCAWLGGAARLR